mmetsp:Transcript_3200/g.7704  ORF Transcript_3200/g.7704 Transcript_3200/m.7704 type:complete len:288 (-) Transcript_3200:270-1133(-)|eukprot:757326-Hanusia_phi.AAC.2
MSRDNLNEFQQNEGDASVTDKNGLMPEDGRGVEMSAEGKEGVDAEGFQSGLGLRKTLRLHLDNAIKFWDHSVHDLVNKLQQNKDANGVEQVHSNALEADLGNHRNAIMGVQPSSEGLGDETKCSSEPVASSEAHLAGDGRSEELPAADDELEPPPVPPGSNPWSPISRPITMALDAGKQMGRRLADVWDVHDILDDLKEQRDYWRRKREQHKLMEELALDQGGNDKDPESPVVQNQNQADFFDFLIKIDRDITERSSTAPNSSEPEKEEAQTASCMPGNVTTLHLGT